MKLEDISEQAFKAYERVRVRGLWNMFDPNAQRASGLDSETYSAIMRHYGQLLEKFPDVRKE